MEIALLFALLLLNGAFAMSEIALLTARKARLQRLGRCSGAFCKLALQRVSCSCLVADAAVQ
jgi:CBS domain containing-hemolysin-like protein